MGECALSDIAEIVMGQSPKGEDCNNDPSGFPLLNGPTEFGPRHPVAVQFTKNPKKYAKPDDILFCVRGSTTGRMNFADREYAIGRGLAAIRGKNGFSTAFVKGVIDLALPTLLRQATGSTFPNVSSDMLSGMSIPCVDAATAATIGRILSSLDDKIELNRQMNATLEAMARALFKAWFVDFEPVHANLENRPSTSASPEIAKLFPSDFENGIPKGWEIVELVDVCERITKGTTPKKFADHGINFIKAESLTTGRGFIREKLAFIDDATNNSLSRSQLRKDDVLFSIAGTIGRIARVIPDILPANTNQALAIVRANKDRIDPLFIEMLLSREEILHSLAGKTVQAVQANLSLTVLGATEFALPSQELLHKAFPVINSFDLKIKENSRENEVLKQLRDSLLPRLISGRIQVGE